MYKLLRRKLLQRRIANKFNECDIFKEKAYEIKIKA